MYEVNLERYYNRFPSNPQFKDYKQLLFRAGDTIQSAELNELQITLKNDISEVAKRFVTNGDFISGGEISVSAIPTNLTDINGDPTFDWKISCSAGVFFAEGEFVDVPQREFVQFNLSEANATFSFGVLYKYSVILEGEDSTLLDPAIGTRNFGLPGSGRLKITASWEFDNVAQDVNNVFFKKHEIINGSLVVNGFTNKEFSSKVTEIVAEYDRESNGNYVIDGLKTIFTSKTTNLGNFTFQISEGKANVGGYKYEKGFTSTIVLPELIDFKLIQSEPVSFTTNGNYELTNKPIRKTLRISGERNQILNITKGVSGGIDSIPSQYQPVIRINSISDGATTYIEGTDFTLDADRVNWGLSGAEPATGALYTLDIDYSYTETDPTFTGTNGLVNNTFSGISLEGFRPNSQVFVDYDIIMERVDSIIMDNLGNFNSIKGVASENGSSPPRIDTYNNLRLADVVLSGDRDPAVTYAGQRAFSYSEIEKLYDSLVENAYNINKLAIKMDLTDRGSNLKNSFTDNFLNDNNRDVGFESVSGYIPALSVAGDLTLNVNWYMYETKPIDIYGVNIFPSTKQFLRLGSIGSSLGISQPHYTKMRKINEFASFIPPRATLKVTPELYRWVDKKIFINLVNDVGLLPTVRSWWGIFANSLRTTTVSKSSSISRSRKSAIIPQIQLQLTSKVGDFNSAEDVDIMWNGKVIKTDTTSSTGQLVSTITVPANEVSGTKEISTKGIISGVEGSTNFFAQPLTLTVTNTTTRIWSRRFIRTWWGDPVAQSFTFINDTVIDKIRVYFATAPTTFTFMQIVELTAGFPDTSKVLHYSEVPAGVIQSDSYYDFILEDKFTAIGGKSYAFIIGCNDSNGEVKVARIGERTINTGIWLTSQADTSGVFFNSSNNQTWTAIQEEDMMYEIYTTSFESTKDFIFEDITVTDATELMIFTESEISEGNSITYKVDLINTFPLETIHLDPHRQYRIGHLYSGPLRVTATMKSDGKFSPVLRPDIQISVGKTDLSSQYTSVAFNFDPTDIKLVAYLDSYKEVGSSYTIQAQVKQSNVWNWVDMVVVGGTQLGDGWIEDKFELDITSLSPDIDQTKTRIRINLFTNDAKNKVFINNLRLNSLSL